MQNRFSPLSQTFINIRTCEDNNNLHIFLDKICILIGEAVKKVIFLEKRFCLKLKKNPQKCDH